MMNRGITSRRLDLDWLRVIAFGLLIYFHTAVAFLPKGIPMIVNDESSLILMGFVAFLQEFRLALLFLVAGVGVCFALKRRDRSAFLLERSQRLLVPLVFGILVLVPPMVFLEKRFLLSFTGGFWDFYQVYFSSGTYPSGHLSWHHFWFVAYLFLFCVLGWPCFDYLRQPQGAARMDALVARLRHGAGLFLPILPLLLVEIPLRPLFPGFRDLIHDWASFSHWFLVFLAGFVLARYEVLLDRAQALRRVSLCIALICSSVLFVEFWPGTGGSFTPVLDEHTGVVRYLSFCLVRITNVWCWLLVCLGYAGRYLRHGGPLLSYLNRGVYPLFCVHLPIIVALDYLVIPLDWSIAAKFLTITSGTLIGSWLSYEVIRRVSWMRPLFGLKPNSIE